jgi:hypothetical protein
MWLLRELTRDSSIAPMPGIDEESVGSNPVENPAIIERRASATRCVAQSF